MVLWDRSFIPIGTMFLGLSLVATVSNYHKVSDTFHPTENLTQKFKYLLKVHIIVNQNPFSSRILGETCCQDQRPQLSSSNLSLSQVIFSKQKDIFLPIRGLSVPTGAGGNFVYLTLQLFKRIRIIKNYMYNL